MAIRVPCKGCSGKGGVWSVTKKDGRLVRVWVKCTVCPGDGWELV